MSNGFYNAQFSQETLQALEQRRQQQQQQQQHNSVNADGDGMMGVLGSDCMASSSMDGLFKQQNKNSARRSSMSYNSGNNYAMELNQRPMSWLDFGDATSGNPLDQFQFDPTTTAEMDEFINTANQVSAGNDGNIADSSGLSMNAQFASQNYDNMGIPESEYASPIHPAVNLDMEMASPFMTSAMPLPMDGIDPSMSGMMDNSQYFPSMPPHFTAHSAASPMRAPFSVTPQIQPRSQPQPQQQSQQQSQPRSQTEMRKSSAGDRLEPQQSSKNTTPELMNSRPTSTPQSTQSGSRQSGTPTNQTQLVAGRRSKSVSFGPEPPPPSNTVSTDATNNIKVPWPTPADGFPSSMHGRTHMETQYKDAYSSTGFDMLNILMRVATRPNPEISIGSVDLSCAFVVTDAEKDDLPIVYCSENFERLTGYTKHMILGRNCRFLQSPDGIVEPGIKRKYVDDDSVFYLKSMVSTKKEVQISLINYRRGGQPFMNLLTLIPITMDGPHVKYIVGLQVDLVEQPNAVTSKNSDGSYTINYQRGLHMPRYVMQTPEASDQMDLGQTIARDEVSTVLTTIGTGESELSKRIWDMVLLENTDDVVHVLSLKGLFLYLSPSCRKVLEYEAGELIGTALSSVCHPSDIVPVTREFKDTSSGSSVNVVFRIRRKSSGYMWFESHGSLHTEHGKGRKCIILVGRERPVYSVSKSQLGAWGGIGENELWTKMSTSGMFLFVSSNARQLLDRQPEDMVGTSIQALMRQESRGEIARMLALARTGKMASVQHEMMNKRGQVLKAFTTIYPGDATEGLKPTFLVAQTRLIRFQRGGNAANARPALSSKPSENSDDSRTTSMNDASSTDNTATMSNTSIGQYIPIGGTPQTCPGSRGLVLGHQDAILASEENLFDELKTTRCTSWQYELRQMERQNRLLAEEVQHLLAAKKKRKRRKGAGQLQKDCANCHTRTTPEWRRGPSGNRDLCNSCGLRWAKQNGRISPRASSLQSVASEKASKASASPMQLSMSNGDLADMCNVGASSVHGYAQKNQGSISPYPSHARIESGPSQGLISSLLPGKIDEAIEPD